MGEFGGQYLKQAKRATAALRHSVYSRYYLLDDAMDRLVNMSPEKIRYEMTASGNVKQVTPARFLELLAKLYPNVSSTGSWSGMCPLRGSWTVSNGITIERCAILTTHNIHDLITLVKTMSPDELNEAFFIDVCQSALTNGVIVPMRHMRAMKSVDYHTRLRAETGMAQGWRQLIVLLAHLEGISADAVRAFVDRNTQAASKDAALAPLLPLLLGLRRACDAGRRRADHVPLCAYKTTGLQLLAQADDPQ